MTQAQLTEEQKRIEKELAKQISLARYIMADRTPFFGILSQNLKIRVAPLHLRNVILTAAVTPTGICMYNPDFLKDKSFEEICGVLAHEALHPGLDFFGRFKNKNLPLANRAHDYAINLFINDNRNDGLSLPDGALLDEKYRGLSAEEIYFLLDDEDKNRQRSQQSTQGSDNGQQSTQGSDNGQQSTQGGDNGQPSTQGSDNGQPSTQGSDNGQPSTQGGDNGQPSTQGSDNGQQSTQGSDNGQPSTQGGDNGQQSTQGSDNGQQSTQGSDNGIKAQGDNDGRYGRNYTLEDDINQDIIEAIENEYYGTNGRRPSKEEMKEQREQAKQRWKDALEQAVIAEKNSGKGSLPAWLQTEIDGILNPKLNIAKMLRRFFGKFGQRTLATYKKRNRRNLFDDNTFPRPGLKANKPSLYVLIDTSGSMWDQEGFNMVRGALGIIKNLANNGSYGIRVIMCDTDVTEDLSFEDVTKAVNKKSLKALGGGGSNFIPAFEYIWEDAVTSNNSQAPILCITDGYIDVPESQPKIRTETMWVTPQGINPPTREWGSHAEMIF